MPLDIGTSRTCDCPPNHLCCLTAKEWLKNQSGVWRFAYERRDIRDKTIHPATYPISLARRVIEQFTHRGELVLDPFVGSGTTLIAARDAGRNAAGFDLSADYIAVAESRIAAGGDLLASLSSDRQVAVRDDALRIPSYLAPDSASLIVTSPPYADLLNRKRKNKSRRDRRNDQFGKVEQYSQDARDLGTMPVDAFAPALGDIFGGLLPVLRPGGHCVVNVPDVWMEGERVTIHISVVDELRRRGYELRNTIIWDRTNIVNGIGIFGWPSNYITMGTTFEYLLDFRRPPT